MKMGIKQRLAVVLVAALMGMTSLAVEAAAIGHGNLVVSRVGNGTTGLVSTGGGISLLEYTTTGTLLQTISISTFDGTTHSGLQWNGIAVSEGAISLSQDNQSLTLVGYNPPFSGSGSLSSRTNTHAPRAFLTVGLDGTVSAPTNIEAYSGNHLRSGVVSDTGTYFAGGNSGTIYRTGSTNTTVQSTVANTRVVNIINGKLYFSSAWGANRGVWTFDTNLPTASSTATLLMNQGGTGDVYDFAINSDKTVAYLTNGSVIQRWAFDGSSWAVSHTSGTVGTGLTGLGVVFGATSDSIFTVNPGSLFGLTFNGTTFSSATTLASAGTHFAFRGLEVTPIPEPATIALLALGSGMMLLRWRQT